MPKRPGWYLERKLSLQRIVTQNLYWEHLSLLYTFQLIQWIWSIWWWFIAPILMFYNGSITYSGFFKHFVLRFSSVRFYMRLPLDANSSYSKSVKLETNIGLWFNSITRIDRKEKCGNRFKKKCGNIVLTLDPLWSFFQSLSSWSKESQWVHPSEVGHFMKHRHVLQEKS